MSSEPRLFRVNPESGESQRVDEVDFARLGLQERRDIQEWVAANPGILCDDLLMICKEFSGFDRTNERLDLLAVDSVGKLVIIELKRDDTGSDAHWQAIKYASYLHRADANAIIGMMTDYFEDDSPEDAENRLLQHLDADDLSSLNNGQRIILASHRFAPEVTSAALWLNEQAFGENLITCIRLTPYRDSDTGSVYVQASTIIPVPGIDDYAVSVGNRTLIERNRSGNNFAANLQKAYDRNKGDEVTDFLRKIGQLVVDELPDQIRPDRTSRWGAGWPKWRYYHFWYARPPWSNWGVSYRVNIGPNDGADTWWSNVEFKSQGRDQESALAGISLHPDQQSDQAGIVVRMGSDTLNEGFANRVAEMTRKFIGQITPIVDGLENESDETGA